MVMMKCDKEKIKDDKENEKKEDKKDENEGEPGRGKGKFQSENMGVYKNGQGWVGEIGASRGS